MIGGTAVYRMTNTEAKPDKTKRKRMHVRGDNR